MDYINHIHTLIQSNKTGVSQLVICNWNGNYNIYKPTKLSRYIVQRTKKYVNNSFVFYVRNTVSLNDLREVIDKIQDIFGVFYFYVRDYDKSNQYTDAIEIKYEDLVDIVINNNNNIDIHYINGEVNVNNATIYAIEASLYDMEDIFVSCYTCPNIFSKKIYYIVEDTDIQCLYHDSNYLLRTKSHNDIPEYLINHVNQNKNSLITSVIISDNMRISKEQLTIDELIADKIAEQHNANIQKGLEPIVFDHISTYTQEHLNALNSWVKNEDGYIEYMTYEEYNLLREMIAPINKTVYRGLILFDFNGQTLPKDKEMDSWTYDIGVALNFIDFAYTGNGNETFALLEIFCKEGIDVNLNADISTVLTYNGEKEVILPGVDYKVLECVPKTYKYKGKDMQYLHIKVTPTETKSKIVGF